MARRRRDGRAVRESRGVGTLEGYRDFIDDWDAFTDAIRAPEPTTLRANVLRIDRSSLAGRLEAQGFTVEPVAHQPAFLKVVDGPRPVSDTLEHWAGLCYIQQTATGLAAPLLAPRPGDRVLDLCSAPGGKTTHIAELMGGKGAVVASDVNETRIRALLGNVYRLGHTNVMTVAGDGRNFPLGATFDRVMVDVPCSAEGTLRKKGGKLPGHSPKWAKQVSRAQERLLRRAVALTRPGGTLLYVTCTFGPHENEAVLTRVLADTPLEVERLDLTVPHAGGLSSFRGEAFDPRLAAAARIYPHHLDSGGLFLCRLRKPDAGEWAERSSPAPDGDAGMAEEPDRHDLEGRKDHVTGWTPVPAVFPGEDIGPGELSADVEAASRFLGSRFGVDPDSMSDLCWMRRGTNLWGHTLDAWPMEAWQPGGNWRTVAVGMRSLDFGGKGPPRPTNDLVAWLGDRITEHRVELDRPEWFALLVEGERSSPGDDGPVALVYRGEVLGRGFRRDGRLRHEIPKGRLNWLRNVMAE